MAETASVVAIDRAQLNTEALVSLFFTKYHRRVMAHCFNMLRSQVAAEDASMETWHKALRRRSEFRGKTEGEFVSWVFKIATTTCLDIIKSRKTEYPLEQRTLGGEHGEEAIVTRLAIEQALRKMPEIYRQTFVLYYIEGLSRDELSFAINKPWTTIFPRIQRARESFRKLYMAETNP